MTWRRWMLWHNVDIVTEWQCDSVTSCTIVTRDVPQVWDEELSRIAQRHADQCTFAHDCSSCRKTDRSVPHTPSQSLTVSHLSHHNNFLMCLVSNLHYKVWSLIWDITEMCWPLFAKKCEHARRLFKIVVWEVWGLWELEKMIYNICLTSRVIINTNLQTIKVGVSVVRRHATLRHIALPVIHV